MSNDNVGFYGEMINISKNYQQIFLLIKSSGLSFQYAHVRNIFCHF